MKMFATAYGPRKLHDVEGKQPCKGSTIGELIEYLQQFPKNYHIGILDKEGVLRTNFFLEDQAICTVLKADGAEYDY